jgi:hypothetical protein
MSAEEPRRGAVKAAPWRGTLALLTKIPFIPLFILPPSKAGVSKEEKMHEKLESVQLMMHQICTKLKKKCEKQYVFWIFQFFQLCSNVVEYQRINNADSIFPCKFASFKISCHPLGWMNIGVQIQY